MNVVAVAMMMVLIIHIVNIFDLQYIYGLIWHNIITALYVTLCN